VGVAFSSGFFGFYAHAGFLAALRSLGVSPIAYSGASSGAIVAAMAACGMSDGAIREILFRVKKEDFWDPEPWVHILRHGLRLFRGYAGYLKGEAFEDLLLRKLPNKKIEDCETPLAVSATNLTEKQEAVFASGDLARAVHASGAVPIFFKPVKINGCLYVDGGVVNKTPLKGLADLVPLDRIIVHFIASENVEEEKNGFLNRRMTPWHLNYLAVNIGRQEAYQRQLEWVRLHGIDVLEVRTHPPPLGPNRLHRGPEAYGRARDAALEVLRQAVEPEQASS
jgi:NTE family protein